jgi:hypothetical protein
MYCHILVVAVKDQENYFGDYYGIFISAIATQCASAPSTNLQEMSALKLTFPNWDLSHVK